MKLNTRGFLKAGVAPVVLGLALLSAPAFAQTQTDPGTGPVEGQTPTPGGDEAATEGDVVVTGSRIPQPNLSSASPITVVNSAEIKQTGTTRVEDLINSLPQVFAGQGSNVSNGATGTATVNLRGLGEERNLVLVNGRRLLPGDPNSAAADLNAIPAALVKRVEVLTGGASSVYGADAVAGVVNFIMDTDLQGFRVDGQYSFYQHDNRADNGIRNALNARGFGFPDGTSANGGAVDATIAFGTDFGDDRGHLTAYTSYRNVNPVLQGSRDYSSCSLTATSQASVAAGGRRFNCGGSATSANGSFIINDNGTSTFFQVGSGRNFIPGSTPYNFGPINYFQRPDERYTAGFFADYEISDALKPYAEFMFMDDRTVAQIAPSGNFGNTFSLNCDSPLLSAQQRALVCDRENLLINASGSVDLTGATAPFQFTDPVTGATYNRGFAQILRRNVEGGGRQDDLQHTSYRTVLGMKGDLGKGIGYDAYYQYGRTIFAETYLNDFSVSRLTNALDVVTGPGGTPICRSAQAGGSDPNCVPYDIFAPGAVSAAALNYLQVPGFQRGINTEQVFNATISASLGDYGFTSPFATGGIGFAGGFEYRKETLNLRTDIEFQTGDLAGQGAATLPVSGQFDVREGFGEVRVPIVEDKFFHELTFTGGYRYSDYKTSAGRKFNTSTYKLQGEFAPIRDVRFRGGYNRAVRTPTVQDFFAPQRVVLDGTTDPCAGRVLTAADTGCLAQGLRVGQNVAANPSGQYNGLIGGNPDLSPEKADTYTVGVILQPSFLPRLALSVDAFDIKLDRAIQGIGADTIINVCTATADPTFCGLINRDQFGSLWRSSAGYIINTTQNIGGLSTRGIDVNGSYGFTVAALGSFNVSFVGTYLDRLKTDTGVSGSFDCKGLYGAVCGTPNPKWRHQARIGYNAENGVGLSLRWRYFDPVRQDTTSGNPNLAGAVQPANRRIPSVSYFDLSANARIAENYNFRIGVNNILDRSPPIVGTPACPAGSCNGNTFAQVYDALGRYLFAGVTLDF